MVPREDPEFQQMMKAAESRERIRCRTRAREAGRSNFQMMLFVGALVALIELIYPDSRLLRFITWSSWSFAFGIYTGFLGTPRTFEGEHFYFKWSRTLRLWGEFGHQGRTTELIIVMAIPLVGLIARLMIEFAS